MDRTRKLLERGYFPVQLPPPFTTNQLARKYRSIAKVWATKGRFPASKGELFSVARTGHRRRTASIQNPIAQMQLASSVAKFWKPLAKHFATSKLSISTPKWDAKARRAIKLPSLLELQERKTFHSAGYRYVLKTDVSQFFPTIYTHSVPWALHGKSQAKRHRRVLTSAYFGNVLDAALQNGQDGQTFGIPIGPDTSRIIAECVGTAVDVEVKRRLKKWPIGFRYVDDYYLFFDDQVAAETALAALAGALKQFELQLNFEKTQICPVHHLTEDYWIHQLRAFSMSSVKREQRRDVSHYFDFVLQLASKSSDESVVKYALKRLGSVVIRKENWALFEAQICKMAIAHPHALQSIADILCTYAGYGYPVDRGVVGRVCNGIIVEQGALGHHGEVAWSLWLCKALKLPLTRAATTTLSAMHSSVCALLALDLHRQKLARSGLTLRYWREFMRSDALYDDLWLLSYEAGVRNWLSVADTHVTADTFFGELAKRNIRFYDEDARPEPLFKVKPRVRKALGISDDRLLFDSRESDLSEFVDFRSPDSEYDDLDDGDEGAELT